MEPKSFGQKLGIGVRVASRIAKEHLDAHTQPAAPAPEATPPSVPAQSSALTPSTTRPSSTQPTSSGQPTLAQTTAAQAPAPPTAEQTSRAQAAALRAASIKAAGTIRQTTQAASRTAREQAPKVVAEVVQKTRGFKVGVKRFRQALWGPFAHISSVLWSEITGVFFGLFAFYFARGAFQYRYAIASGAADHGRFVLDLAMTILFGYFAVSSFYIARRKEKKRR